MAKRAAIGVRFGPEEEDALRRAAKEDARPVAAMARKAAVEWLRQHGWLGAGAEPDAPVKSRVRKGKPDA